MAVRERRRKRWKEETGKRKKWWREKEGERRLRNTQGRKQSDKGERTYKDRNTEVERNK